MRYRVIFPSVIVRDRPSTRGTVRTRLRGGQQVEVLQSAAGESLPVPEDPATPQPEAGSRSRVWHQVRTPNGIVGWVYARLLQEVRADG